MSRRSNVTEADLAPRTCQYEPCGATFTIGPDESGTRFKARRFCQRSCASAARRSRERPPRKLVAPAPDRPPGRYVGDIWRPSCPELGWPDVPGSGRGRPLGAAS